MNGASIEEKAPVEEMPADSGGARSSRDQTEGEPTPRVGGQNEQPTPRVGGQNVQDDKEIICIKCGMENEEEAEAEEGRKAKVMRNPGNPTRAEIEEHELTHIPFMAWCAACVRGKAANNPHYKGAGEIVGEEEDRLPKICMDYKFLGDTDEKGEPINANENPVLVIWDDKSKACMSFAVEHKGRDEWAARWITQFTDMLGYKKDHINI